jgi:hypothetical protein
MIRIHEEALTLNLIRIHEEALTLNLMENGDKFISLFVTNWNQRIVHLGL